MNTKSNMYHNKIDKQFTNNSIFYSTLDKNNKVFESNDIRKKIQNIFFYRCIRIFIMNHYNTI